MYVKGLEISFTKILIILKQNEKKLVKKSFLQCFFCDYNYFDNVNDHITELAQTYLAQIAGTPSNVPASTMGFISNQGAGQ